jgi:hypothetical protein
MKSLIVSGAGFNLFNQLGALKVIFPDGVNNHYDNYIGASAGALFSILLAMDWNPVDIQNYFIQNWTSLNTLLTIDPTYILTNGSLYDPNVLIQFINGLIVQTPIYKQYFSNYDPNVITFAQLYAVNKKNVIITVTDITDTEPYLPGVQQTLSPGRPAIISNINTPDVTLSMAALAAISLLPLTSPTNINGTLYLDCAYTLNFPASLFDPNSPNYYKTWYPCNHFPVDLDCADGVWYVDPVFYIPPVTPWTITSLIDYISTTVNFGINDQIQLQENTNLYKDHTILLNGLPVAAFPTVQVIEEQINLGFIQATKQHKKLHHHRCC